MADHYLERRYEAVDLRNNVDNSFYPLNFPRKVVSVAESETLELEQDTVIQLGL